MRQAQVNIIHTLIIHADRDFATRDKVISHLNMFAITTGFAIVVTKSYYNRNSFYLGCWQSRRHRTSVAHEKDRQKEARTHKCAYPFEIKVFED